MSFRCGAIRTGKRIGVPGVENQGFQSADRVHEVCLRRYRCEVIQ